jgi:hypothetical protein
MLLMRFFLFFSVNFTDALFRNVARSGFIQNVNAERPRNAPGELNYILTYG